MVIFNVCAAEKEKLTADFPEFPSVDLLANFDLRKLHFTYLLRTENIRQINIRQINICRINIYQIIPSCLLLAKPSE